MCKADFIQTYHLDSRFNLTVNFWKKTIITFMILITRDNNTLVM